MNKLPTSPQGNQPVRITIPAGLWDRGSLAAGEQVYLVTQPRGLSPALHQFMDEQVKKPFCALLDTPGLLT
jgi:hypothetical protein